MGLFLNNYEARYNIGRIDPYGQDLFGLITWTPVGPSYEVVDVTITVHMKSGDRHNDHVGAVSADSMDDLHNIAHYYLEYHDTLHVGGRNGAVWRAAVVATKDIESVEISGTIFDANSDEDIRRNKFKVEGMPLL